MGFLQHSVLYQAAKPWQIAASNHTYMKLSVKICMLLAFLIGATSAFCQTRIGPFFYGGHPPATPPTAFAKAHIWADTLDLKTYKYANATWQETNIGLYTPGSEGKPGKDGRDGINGTNGIGIKGDKGDAGICPNCPPSGTGGSFPSIYGKTAFPTNEAEYLNAISLMANGTIRNITLFNDIILTRDYALPKAVTGNQTKRLDINLNNYGLIDNSTIGLKSLIGRFPSDQTEALNVMQSWAINIHDGYLRGKGSLTKTAVDLGSTYNSNIYNLQLDNFKDGIVLRFCLMATVRNIMVNGCTNIGISVDRGNWTGVGTANAQSNHTLVEQVRVFNVGGAFAAFNVIDASGIILRQCISEGGSPQYHVYWDSMGATVVKDGWIFSLHLESPSTIAGIKLFLASGYFIASGCYSQYDNILFDVEASLGYPHMYVENVPWMTGGSKLKTKGTSVIWNFKEVSFDPTNSALWVGGVKPYYWSWQGMNQSPFWNGNSIKINGSTNGLASTTSARLVGQPAADWDVEILKTDTGYNVLIYKAGIQHFKKSFASEKVAQKYYDELNTVDLAKGIM